MSFCFLLYYKPDDKVFKILAVDNDSEYPGSGYACYIFKIKENNLKT